MSHWFHFTPIFDDIEMRPESGMGLLGLRFHLAQRAYPDISHLLGWPGRKEITLRTTADAGRYLLLDLRTRYSLHHSVASSCE
jgi:hypothetical protein